MTSNHSQEARGCIDTLHLGSGPDTVVILAVLFRLQIRTPALRRFKSPCQFHPQRPNVADKPSEIRLAGGEGQTRRRLQPDVCFPFARPPYFFYFYNFSFLQNFLQH